MSRGNASGIRLRKDDIPIVLGMQKRGDRDHDIAAWFGVNQGRVAEAKDGRYDHVTPASSPDLPPKGPPGLKGRELKESVEAAVAQFEADGVKGDGLLMLRRALKGYDQNER